MLEYWLWLAHRPGMNDSQKRMLLQSFQTPENVYRANKADFAAFSGITAQGAQALADKNLAPYQAALEDCQRKNIRVLTIQEQEYPYRLQNIYDPPLVLYCRGRIPPLDDVPVIGVVGTRKSTAYGRSAAGRIAGEIAAAGGIVVSGLAAGIDTAAVLGAMRTGMPVVGILGTGVDVIYPRENREVFRRVEECGCLMSEFLPRTAGFKWNFPRRNRIISGISLATLVVEAPERSGALSTAHQALNQGRDVYVVPGNIDLPSFAGSNRLLQEGAAPITCGQEIMSEYLPMFRDKMRKTPMPAQGRAAPSPSAPEPYRQRQEKIPQPREKDVDKPAPGAYIDNKNKLPALSAEEKRIVDAMGKGNTKVDDLIAETGIPSGTLLRNLTMLELKKVIVRLPGNRVARKR